MSDLSTKCADVLRAEAWGLDIEETTHGVSVFAMRKDGTLYELGHIAHEAVMQDPSGARHAIERIKFAAHQPATPPQQAAGEPVGEQISRAEAIRLINALIEGDTLPPSSLELLRELTRPAPGAPDGFALVPVEQTDEIRQAFFSELSGAACSYFDDDSDPSGGFSQAWRNALAAAQAKGGE